MANQKYIITEPEKLKEGGIKSLKNAQNHFEAFKILSDNKKYGLAISHSVLAAEEAIKAFELLAASVIDWEENFKVLFRNHNVKLGLVKFLIVLDLIFGRISEAILWQLEYTDGEPTEEEFKAMEKIQKEKSKELKSWLIKQSEDDSQVAQHANWWENANDLEKEGFYVDYSGKKWESPVELSKNEYDKALKHVEYLLEKVQNIKSIIIEDPEIFQEMYNDYIDYLNKD